MLKIKHLAFAALLAVLIAIPGTVGATSYVMMEDAELYAQANSVAVVNVLSVGPAPAAGAPSIDYIVLVERLLKGQISGSTVVLRIPGGVGPDGWGFELIGAPRFAAGDRAIVFLAPRRDGTYGVLHLMLGAFHEFSAGGHHLALRDLHEANGARPRARPARDFVAFTEWLANGATTAPDYLVQIPSRRLDRWMSAFAALRHEQRLLRWFEDEVEWKLGRQAPLGSKRLLKEALRTWQPIANFRLQFAGRTDASQASSRFDGVNSVAFMDPENLIPGSFSCAKGGVIAISGPWFDPDVTAKSRPGSGSPAAIKILGADIVVNDGSECLLAGIPDVSLEVLTKELGHSLGLGFSCGDASSGPCEGSLTNSVMRALLSGGESNVTPTAAEASALETAQ